MAKQFVQGDVMFTRLARKPLRVGKKALADNGRYVIARGEKSGHMHTIDANAATLLGSNVVVVHSPAAVTHNEHDPLELQPGIYRVYQQREYNYDEPARFSYGD